MMPLLLLLGASFPPPPAADVVHLRDGKKVDGRVTEHDTFVEVESADGKKTRVPRLEVVRIELAPNFIRCPETVPFPSALLEKGLNYESLSFRRMLILTPKPPGTLVLGIDVNSAAKTWEFPYTDRASPPVLVGPVIYFLQKQRSLDPARKILIGTVLVPREIHKLLVTAIEVETGKVLWTQAVDGADRRDLIWEYAGMQGPTLTTFPDRVVISSNKIGHPLDKDNKPDKEKIHKFSTLTTYDPERKRVISAVDSPDTLETATQPYLTQELAVFQVTVERSKFKLAAIGQSDGKLRWQGADPYGLSTLAEVNEDQIYLSDPLVVSAYTTKTGKKVDKWAVDLNLGPVLGIDAHHVYQHRAKKAPYSLVAIDVKKGTDAWTIPLAENNAFLDFHFTGHRLIYVDRLGATVAWDTLKKKELWRFQGTPSGATASPRAMGSVFTFYREGRVMLLDLETGTRIWDIRTSPNPISAIRSISQVGDAGILLTKLAGTDLVRERRLPSGALLFTPSGTPLRHATGEENWSLPAFAGDAVYTLGSSGTLMAVKASDKSQIFSNRLHNTPLPVLAAPIVTPERIAVHINQETHVFGPDGKTRQYQLKHSVFRAEGAGDLTPAGLLTATSGGLVQSDFASGKLLWKWDTRGLAGYGLSPTHAWAITVDGLIGVDLKDGSPGIPLAIPRNSSQVAVDGKRLVVAQGPFAVGLATPETEFQQLFKTKVTDTKISYRFKGFLAATGGLVLFSHAEGGIVCISAADGKVLWTFPAPKFTSPLLVSGDRVWFAAEGIGLRALALKDGAPAWAFEAGDAQNFTPFLHEGKPAFWSVEGWMLKPE